jgi:hypothetical protein
VLLQCRPQLSKPCELSEMSLMSPGETNLLNLEIGGVGWRSVLGTQNIPTNDSRELIQLGDQFILLEFHPLVVGLDSEGPSSGSRIRVNHLVNILHQGKPERYHCLAARGYFVEASQFALCFNIPDRLHPEHQGLSFLLKKLTERDLEYKFISARDLSTALW